MDSYSELESKIISVITLLMSLDYCLEWNYLDSRVLPLTNQILILVTSMDLDSQPRPESKLMSLVTETISLFNSMDLESQPKPSELMSLITQLVDSKDSDSEQDQQPEPELMSLIHQIFSLVISMKWEKLISVAPQVRVLLEEGKFHVAEEVRWRSSNKWQCLSTNWKKFGLRNGEDPTHFFCRGCYGKSHEEYEKAPLEIKHALHPKHSLQLVLFECVGRTKDCYCCDEALKEVIYYCSVCEYALNIACVEKQRVLSIDHPKWHQHTLAFFPSQASFPCNLCALAGSTSCPFYICPPCDFVVHQSCISLPRVIKISRHPHRISFTPSFNQGDWSCGVCRKRIDNDYGGYSCIKKGCSYGVHSKCATQSNVWDGKELEGEPEIEDEVEPPFVRISDGVIQHFSHERHHLRLDENKSKDYNENKLCQSCITPIYFGNSYSCMQCDFILHETCANLSRKMHHPIHPHMLTLFERNDNAVNDVYDCVACSRPGAGAAGFFYVCGERGCHFKLHLQCATVYEPLVHGSHMHPLFLTSKPGERRTCSTCGTYIYPSTNETFNCIECECDFALCFRCATIPQKVRYKYDNHMLALSYGEETSHKTNWCESCERKINPKKWFYMCGENCWVTLHVECMLGEDLYMEPGSSWVYNGAKVDVLPNNQHMSRPICSNCKKRCPYKIVFQLSSRPVLCSLSCLMISLFTLGWPMQ